MKQQPSRPSFDFAMEMRGSLPETIASSDLPTLNQGLEFLFADLREASRLFHEPGDDGRAGALAAVGACVRFVRLFKGPLAENLEIPGLRLQDARGSLRQHR
jgi:hypothetical protein